MIAVPFGPTAMAATGTRSREIHRVLWLVLLANLGVAAAKLVYGFISGSLAIRADGFHSVLDGANNVVALIIMRVATQPPDQDHPYGHRKFEVLGSMAIGAMILLLILRVGEDALAALRGHRSYDIGPEAYGVLVATLAINLTVTGYEQREGRRLDSPLLTADAKHTLADVFVTLAVLAGIVGVRFGFPKADALATLGVIAVLAWIGYGILRRGVGVLADETVITESDLAGVARTVDGVLACPRARSRGSAGDIQVDLVIEADPHISLRQAHEIADHVEEEIHRCFPGVADLVVHVEPHRHRESRAASREPKGNRAR